MTWPISLLTRALKGSDLTPAEADGILSTIQGAVNAAMAGWGKDEDHTAGLTWGDLGGQGWDGSSWTTVAGGTVLLVANSTNYIERTLAGVRSVNQTGWTAGLLPSFKVVTDSAGVVSWEDMRGAWIPFAFLGAPNGVATLDGGGKVPTLQLPALAITDTFVVASQAAMLALSAQQGDVAIRSDLGYEGFILTTSDPTTLANWQAISPMNLSSTAPVMDGTVSAGSSSQASRGDHVHPTDSSRVALSSVGQPSGVASLDSGGKVPSSQLPALAITDTFVVASQAAMLALSAQQGDVAVRTDLGNEGFILTTSDPTTLANWQAISPMNLSSTAPVAQGAGAVGTSSSAARADHQHPGSYDIGFGCTGKPAASAVILRFPAVRNFSLPTNLSGSQGKAGTAAFASATFNIAKNGTNIGTMVFAAAGTVPTWTCTATSFAPGDILTITAPGTQDANLADIGAVLLGSLL